MLDKPRPGPDGRRPALSPSKDRERTDVAKKHYDCGKCPGYCCSYPNIPLENGDLERLAAHFELSAEQFTKRFTKKGKADKTDKTRPTVLRHKEDHVFGTICTFFDRDERRCTVYTARPDICRDYPGRPRCGYYEFLSFERDAQDDPDYIAVTGN